MAPVLNFQTCSQVKAGKVQPTCRRAIAAELWCRLLILCRCSCERMSRLYCVGLCLYESVAIETAEYDCASPHGTAHTSEHPQ